MSSNHRRWYWDEPTREWGVELDELRGVLKWWGADKPRPGVPAYAQGGGGVDQPIAELLRTNDPPYDCPAGILAEVIEAARRVHAAAEVPGSAADRSDE